MMNSIAYRITGLMFMMITATVVLLIYLANQQMLDHFHEYLMGYNMGMYAGSMPSMMGLPEQNFLASVHRSLIWVGAGIVMIGLVASYALARSITVPLRKLSQAVIEIEKGNFDQKVEIVVEDEVGKLGAAFNGMSEALAANHRQRKRFLADVAHELKTPLSVIQGNLEGMLEGVIDNTKEQLGSLYDETVHLNRMINELRDVSLAEARQLILEKQRTDMNGLIVHVLNMLKPLADEKRIVLKQDLQYLPEIMVDVGRMNQILYNLITNALRYTADDGIVEINTYTFQEQRDNMLVIQVKDNGAGISEEDLPHIFNHFYRADKSRNRKSGGSGIGLAIVKQLVEVHGGKVQADSILGTGSCFTVYLPVQT